MFRSRKQISFHLEALNAAATTFFFYYFYFFMAREYGFGDRQNLALVAAQGFVYMAGAWAGGAFAQRFGLSRSLNAGFLILGVSCGVGLFLHTWIPQAAAMLIGVTGMCFTWPALEALVSEGESGASLQRIVGLYNLAWASASFAAFFVGGALLQALGLRSLFWIPALMHGAQWILLRRLPPRGSSPTPPLPSLISTEPKPSAHEARLFLRMAWFANPFAYVAINTIVAILPGLAVKLHLTPLWTGIFCSVWFLARFIAFLGLWLWKGWHYRFHWFVTAYLLLLLGFVLLALVPNLWWVIGAQAAFGLGIGLLYYASLYYSMDTGDAQAAHGGFHETAIGAGIFVGPAVGAATLFAMPNHPESGVVAVSALLVCGLAGVFLIRATTKNKSPITDFQ